MAIEDNSRSHRCLKISLSVLYTFVIAISIIFLAQAVITLVALSTIDDDNSKSTPRTTLISFKRTTDKERKEKEESFLRVGIVVLPLILLYCSIALFAIVKEKKYILLVFTAFEMVFCGLYLWYGDLFTAIFHSVMAIMLGVFTYIVFKRQKLRQSIASTTSC